MCRRDIGCVGEGMLLNDDVVHRRMFVTWDVKPRGTFYHGSFRPLGRIALGRFNTDTFAARLRRKHIGEGQFIEDAYME